MSSKKIGLTGASGFVGTHLAQRLEELGYKLLLSKVNINEHIPNFEGCSHIVHLAAKVFVPDSWEHPHHFYQTNVLGTAHVLEAARKENIPVTFISSYVYGIPNYLPIDEKHPLTPANPYMQSKIMGEDLCHFYRKNFNLPICILRPFNLYGLGLDAKFLIPLICEQVLDKTTNQLELRALTPKRDYIYITDLVEAIVQSIILPNSETINIASGTSYSVKELAELIMRIAGVDKKIISTEEARPNEIMDTKADIQLAKKTLNWQPTISIEQGIKKIISSLKSNTKNFNL